MNKHCNKMRFLLVCLTFELVQVLSKNTVCLTFDAPLIKIKKIEMFLYQRFNNHYPQTDTLCIIKINALKSFPF